MADSNEDRDDQRTPDEAGEHRPDIQDDRIQDGSVQDDRIRDKRRIDPETGEPRQAAGDDAPAAPAADDSAPSDGGDLSDDDLALLAEAERDLVAEYRERAARAEAELVNFRTRVERDRAANREAVIAEVIRSLLPAIDDLDRAEKHGDLGDDSPLAIVAQKLRGGFDRYGLRRIGEVGEVFDPRLHEALVHIPSPDPAENTVIDVIEVGYALGERLIRAAKVAVAAPAA